MADEPIDPDVDLTDARRRRELRRSHYGVLAVIAAGGMIGTGARYGAGLLWPAAPGSFPWATLGINVSGCLLIGILLVALTEAWTAPAWVRPFFATGVLGGYTTFSTYCVDIERLVSGGRAGTALGYLAATVLAALAAVTAGSWTTRRLLALKTARRTR
ncbi:CrcB family protein [Streptosporangium sp. 'caverna']|uniref:fluoride efflux transporter FluC n=1 Tax=Streptosporangium sp. 'caverna' TaxID=2202249 RepID=UPI000D7EB663|nr:CrcB family protein [Streptosporangium sp. 'caverna']AWS41968.1 chromosome condensation protein CrcB [Streptosporangium sp. 'caverna']